MDKVILRVEGMSCGHCEIAVQDAVRKLPGIKKVKASRRRKEAVVDYDASAYNPGTNRRRNHRRRVFRGFI
jgi:copper chaperone